MKLKEQLNDRTVTMKNGDMFMKDSLSTKIASEIFRNYFKS